MWSFSQQMISADSVPFEVSSPGQAQVVIDVKADGSTIVNGKHVTSLVTERKTGQRITYIATDDQGQYIDNLKVIINLPKAVTGNDIILNAIGAYGIGDSSYQLASTTQILYQVNNLSPQAIYTVQADFTEGYFKLPFTSQIGPTLSALPFQFWLAIGLLLPLLASITLGYLVRQTTSEWRHVLNSKEKRDTPPSEMSPALAGVIVNGKMNARMLAATLVDLAQREYLVISNHSNQFSFGKRRDYTNGASFGNDLAPFEMKLLDKLFLSTSVRSTQNDIDVRLGARLFSRKIAEVYLEVYDSLTNQGYFFDNPNAVYRKYRNVGLVFFFAALFGFALTLGFMSGDKFPLVAWVGMMVASLLIMRGAPFLPRRTKQGVEALKQWSAFRNWLKSNDPIADANNPETYRRYLAYAIAFGVEVEWTRRFVGNLFQPPGWLITQADFVKIDDFASQLFPIVGYVATEMAAVKDPNS